MNKESFDDLIRTGRDIEAMRYLAKEYYANGKMGHTRKLLLERVADDYDKAVALIESMQAHLWVSVNERLPEVDKYGDVNVLVCMDDGFIASATFDKNNGWELWADAGEVTHWMPLPDPPQEGLR